MDSLVQLKGEQVRLFDPRKMPDATAYLWNSCMLLQVNCRGYASASYLQPEPASYTAGPALEQSTFFQPEPQYYSDHPGRFFYLKLEGDEKLFSVPFAPTNVVPDAFEFIARKDAIEWRYRKKQLEISLSVRLAQDLPQEHWQLSITNTADTAIGLDLFSYFPVGYRSWMNQSGKFNAELNAVLCNAITPYQKAEDYEKQKAFKDTTFLVADQTPNAWETRQNSFVGLSGLNHPNGVLTGLQNGEANYQTPTAAMQFNAKLSGKETRQWAFIFGAAESIDEVRAAKQSFQTTPAPDQPSRTEATVHIATPDTYFDDFVNHWLTRQIRYHGELNRLTTDPQTRNYLQDAMGLAFIDPERARDAFVNALRQQCEDGSIPDGILLHPDAELKYINQVPHTDHAVWIPLCIANYLQASGDYGFLDTRLPFEDCAEPESIVTHVERSFDYLLAQRDHRGLSLMGQGDWCDPMNMVGPKGKGVSSWLSLATAYAANRWADICDLLGDEIKAKTFRNIAKGTNTAVNRHLWQEDRYARGITDDDRIFGVKEDDEGSLFLNPQSWAMLSGAADAERCESLASLVDSQLRTDFGVELLAPAFTKMREDIGRVTQKFPGTAENGSIYNHAAAFYAAGLFKANHQDNALSVLRSMLPGPSDEDHIARGQLPSFIPNYYRGANNQFPSDAGRSSQLLHTGTCSWFITCLVQDLFGIRFTPSGLNIRPKLPSTWPRAEIATQSAGRKISVLIERSNTELETIIRCNGKICGNDIQLQKDDSDTEIIVTLSRSKHA